MLRIAMNTQTTAHLYSDQAWKKRNPFFSYGHCYFPMGAIADKTTLWWAEKLTVDLCRAHKGRAQ